MFVRGIGLGVLLSLIGLPCNPVNGQQGLNIQCADCDTYVVDSFPESGIWSNPTEHGNVLSLNVQNGVVVGLFLGYDDQGESAWYLFSGVPQDARPAALSAFTATMIRYSGGACPTCVYQPPSLADYAVEVVLTLYQRNLVGLRVGDGEEQLMITEAWGSDRIDFFPEWSDYHLPDVEGFWSVVHTEASTGLQYSLVLQGSDLSERLRDGRRLIRNLFWYRPNIPELFGYGGIRCEQIAVSNEGWGPPDCEFYVNDGTIDGKSFALSLANIGEGRFVGTAYDGSTIEGFKLDHD